MDYLGKYKDVMADAIDKASKGLMRDVDVLLLNDLKRMSDMGVLEVWQIQPDIKISDGEVKFDATWEGRLYFKGEDTIKDQAARIKDLEERFSHYHVRNEEDDHCRECGLYLTDPIHKRL